MNLYQRTHVVIMAGGVGSRFWPMSSENCPKQFLDILGCGSTLLQLTVKRFETICPPENMWVVTSEKYAGIVREQLPFISEGNILKEPCRRNTAPCIAYASWAIKSRQANANVIVTPTDHYIPDVEKFRESIKSCLLFAAETDAVVTLGVKPNNPETGYGYIEADLSYATPTNKQIYRVDSFKEKPSLELAQEYVRKDNFFWNSGIFVWNVSTIVNAFRVYLPDMSSLFENLRMDYGTNREQELINKIYPECQNISIDYAIMERADEIYVQPADFAWTDLGTWGSLRNNLQRDQYGNACVGNGVSLYETNNCIIHVADEKKVVVQGLNGFIVAEKDGMLLVCKLDEEQRIGLFHD